MDSLNVLAVHSISSASKALYHITLRHFRVTQCFSCWSCHGNCSSTWMYKISRKTCVPLAILKAFGMSVFFRFGDGYTVTLRIGGENPDLEGVSQFIKSLFPTAVLKVLFCFIAPSAIVELISLYLTITHRQLKPTFYMTYLCYLPILSLPICMPACLTTWLSFGLTVSLVSAYLHAYLSLGLSVCLSVSVCLFVCLSVCLSVGRSVGWSVCLCVCLCLCATYLPTYLLTFFTL